MVVEEKICVVFCAGRDEETALAVDVADVFDAGFGFGEEDFAVVVLDDGGCADGMEVLEFGGREDWGAVVFF